MIEIGSDFNIQPLYNNRHEKFFVSGRLAIKSILNNLIQRNEKCLIPNYLCDSIYNCFSCFDFYKIKNDFDINIEYLEHLIKNGDYVLIFIINYFGYIDNNIEFITKLCKQTNIIIVEDYTHNLYSKQLYGDISICSYRKSLSTPYGAIVIDKNNMINIEQQPSYNFVYYFLVIFKFIGMLLKNLNSIKWIWRPLLTYCENNIDKLDYNGYDYLNHFFYKYYYDMNNIEYRKQNMTYLNKFIKIKTLDKFKNNYFTYPIFFKTKVERDHIRKILIDNQIYCPIYWPLYFDKDNICNNHITDHILCIPVDQRYNIKHMEYIVNIIDQAL